MDGFLNCAGQVEKKSHKFDNPPSVATARGLEKGPLNLDHNSTSHSMA